MVQIGKMHNSHIQGYNGIQVGNNLRMGPGVKVVSAIEDPQDFNRVESSDPIRIGNNVWIGMNVVVRPGVTIGDNVVISANATVEKDIPSNSIAAGSPCRVIRQKPPYQGKNYGS